MYYQWWSDQIRSAPGPQRHNFAREGTFCICRQGRYVDSKFRNEAPSGEDMAWQIDMELVGYV